MKKFLDRYLFSRFGNQLLVSALIIVGFSLLAPFIRNLILGVENGGFQSSMWGFRQVSSAVAAISTIESLDQLAAEKTPAAASSILALALIAWIISLAVYSFITGSIVNAFRNRKQRIDRGLVRYRFNGHGIIFGWDFQGVACVKNLLEHHNEVLIVSSRSAMAIREEIMLQVPPDDMARVYIYNGEITGPSLQLRHAVHAELSRTIIILGERNGLDNDGGNLHIERIVHDMVERGVHALTRHAMRPYLRVCRLHGLPAALRRWSWAQVRYIRAAQHRRPPIKLYLHIEDSVLYTQARTMKGAYAKGRLLNIEIVNFYESWAWRCWSAKDAVEDGARADEGAYLPLRFRPDAERVELFVLGSTPMGQAFANYAMALMNYGVDRKHCRVTIFDDSQLGGVFLPEASVLQALPETEVVFRPLNGGSDEANDIMIEAAQDPKTAVTIVIATKGPDAAVRTYAQLAVTLRRMDVSVLVWQETASRNCPEKGFLKTGGDTTRLRYFGMTDRLPWMNPNRQTGGCAVNFFYDLIFQLPGMPKAEMPAALSPELIPFAARYWQDGELARRRWNALPRWKQWSSINSGDSFKEKAAAFPDCATNPDTRMRLLHAEHNRWWTERLLAGWKLGPRDNVRYFHPNLVPFDQLDEPTKDLDKVNIAALAVCGYLK